MAILVYSTMRDHPRVCGEHLPERYPWMLCRGSSPRMRGTHSRRLQRRHPQGIIPAHAGNTPHTTCSWSRNWDHPRVCGEHTCNAPMMHNAMGSSPRMRGTRHGRGVDAALPGIIPAYAGNTEWNRSAQWSNWDHPRVCGEHSCMHCMQSIPEGSSPRMRGTHLVHLQLDDRAGIIPAYAGNTFEGVGPCVFCGDHPRVCGEHMSNFTYWKLHEGSSPRMRGTPPFRKEVIAMCGIIPAYAGNTYRRCAGWPAKRDHPRVCGEHRLHASGFLHPQGSSPRMRGTHAARAANRMAGGIIPAYAGNTSPSDWTRTCGRDHPRVCGEHVL